MAINFNTESPRIAAGYLNRAKETLQDQMAKLASGKRINSAKDDAAGLAIMTEMESQIRAYTQAERNTMDGVSMIQTADGAMEEMGGAVIRMRELALQSANGTLSDDDRAAIDTEMSSLRAEIDRVSSTTEFNGTSLLDGSAGTVQFQVGADASTDAQIGVDLSTPVNTDTLGSSSGTALSGTSGDTAENALSSLSSIDTALQDISSKRADFGAVQNQLYAQQQTLSQARVSEEEAKSRIGDTDVAETTTRLAREQILMQSSSSVIAQANQVPATALALIG